MISLSEKKNDSRQAITSFAFQIGSWSNRDWLLFTADNAVTVTSDTSYLTTISVLDLNFDGISFEVFVQCFSGVPKNERYYLGQTPRSVFFNVSINSKYSSIFKNSGSCTRNNYVYFTEKERQEIVQLNLHGWLLFM